MLCSCALKLHLLFLYHSMYFPLLQTELCRASTGMLTGCMQCIMYCAAVDPAEQIFLQCFVCNQLIYGLYDSHEQTWGVKCASCNTNFCMSSTVQRALCCTQSPLLACLDCLVLDTCVQLHSLSMVLHVYPLACGHACPVLQLAQHQLFTTALVTMLCKLTVLPVLICW